MVKEKQSKIRRFFEAKVKQLPFPIMPTKSTANCTCHLQSFVAAKFSGKQNGNLLQVINSGALPSLDFKGATFSPQTEFLFEKVRPNIDCRFQVQIVWQDGYYLTSNGNELVLEKTNKPSQPNHLFIMVKARPSHAFTFQNAACAAARANYGFINSDENGRLSLGPGDNARAWINLFFERNNNSVETVDGIQGPVCLPSNEEQTLVEMLSYV